MKLFVNREDVYARGYLQNKRMAYTKTLKPITEQLLQDHIDEKITIGVYQLKGKKIKWPCLDFDENTKEDWERAQNLFIELRKQGFHPLLENSGGGKYKTHIWIFCDCEALNTILWLENFCKEMQLRPHEIFPKQNTLDKNLPFGNLVKLPLALHLASKRKSYFMNDNFEPLKTTKEIEEKLQFHLDNLDTFPEVEIKEAIQLEEYKPQQKKPNEFDEFFNYVLNTELPAGKTKSGKYQNIVGVNDNVLKNEAIWFYQKGYSLEDLEKDVKPIFDKNKWVFADLKGWYKKAEKGDITQINIGELAEWCRTYDMNSLELLPKEKEKKKNPYKELFYETRHLPFFKEFDRLMGLHGKHYTCLKKARYYQLVGGIVQKRIRLGGIKTDTRLQVLYPLPTEAGKNSVIYAIKYLIKKGIRKNRNEGTLFTLSEPISYSAESLVGKYIERTEKELNESTGKYRTVKKRFENRGHFNNDFLELDECSQLILSNDEQTKQAREYFSKSENPIGLNEVEKRLVDDLPSEKVSYCPNNTDSFYFQPSEKLPEHFITQGFGRRKISPVGNISDFLIEGTEENIGIKTNGEGFSEDDDANKIISFLEAMRENLVPLNQNVNFIFTEEARKLINSYTLLILRQGKIHSEKIANFCKINKYTTQEYLTKMSCILACAYGKNEVDEKLVSLAFMDLTEFMQNTYDFIFDYVKGRFDYGVVWQGAKHYDIQCLKHLYENEYRSFDSSRMGIAQFLELIQEVYPNNIGDDSARKNYLRMKKQGWIDSSQKGQYDSRVWLKFNPKIQKEVVEGLQGSKGYTIYKEVFQCLNDILATLQPLSPSQP